MRASHVPWVQVAAALVLGAVATLAPRWARLERGGTPSVPRTAPQRGDKLEIEVTASDYNWHLRYPGADGVLGTEDDVEALRHLHLPVGVHATLRLHSRDFVYTLAFPEFGLKEIAVPDLEFVLEIEADEPGEYVLKGDQFCGFSHPDLMGRLVVQPWDEFDAWLATRRQAQ